MEDGLLPPLFLANEAATARLGEDIAMALKPGDAIALKGDLGAGKSTLARALIRALADDAALEVPSPTFTLVQSYAARFPVHHFDLYRLGSAHELDELGLNEMLGDGAALIEWPEQAADRLPAETVQIELTHEGERRAAHITGNGQPFARIARSLAMRTFLESAGWDDATRRAFTGDASARGYEIVTRADEAPRILMNSPPLAMGPPVQDGKPYAEIAHTAKTVAAFVAIDRALAGGGVTVPQIHAQDLDRGFVLMQHLGSEGFLDARRQPIRSRYEAAARLLAMMHGREWAYRLEAAPGIVHTVPPFDRDAMTIEADLLVDWYVPVITGAPAGEEIRTDYRRHWNALLDRLEGREATLMLRDFHSPNIIWRAGRKGHDRLGILDFQDALVGPPAYDVASLAMDARVTVPPEIERATYDAYVAVRNAAGNFDADAFAEAYAIMAAQRNSKILGIFVRLDRRDGKSAYLKHLPRIRDYLRRALAHPALAQLRAFYEEQGFLEERPL